MVWAGLENDAIPFAAVGFFMAIFGAGRLLGLTAFSLGRGSVQKPLPAPVIIDEEDEKPGGFAARHPDRIADATGILGFRKLNPALQDTSVLPEKRG